MVLMATVVGYVAAVDTDFVGDVELVVADGELAAVGGDFAADSAAVRDGDWRFDTQVRDTIALEESPLSAPVVRSDDRVRVVVVVAYQPV